ncbi:MAG TPA: hypothetical protein DCF68_22475 [Cyanothece sp. UBA12306]|nr:hypothetical protein [Cyanothece sp. UBA12306]
MSLHSILTGYQSILLGLDEVGVTEEVNVIDQNLIFSDDFAALNINAKVGGLDLILNGNGSFSGNVGSENVTWTGNWLGTLGTSLIIADDSGTFQYDGTDGYTQLDFLQSGSQDFDFWDGTTIGELTSTMNGSVLPGWSRPGTNGVGGAVSQVRADLETQFLFSGNSIGSSFFMDGDTQFFSLVLDDSTIISDGNYSCEQSKTCTPVPEPASIFGLVTAIGFGAFFKRKLNVTKQDTTEVV